MSKIFTLFSELIFLLPQIDESMYEQTKNPIDPVTDIHIQAIMNADSLYNIDWYQTTWEDLRKPLYSALATLLYIFDQVKIYSFN